MGAVRQTLADQFAQVFDLDLITDVPEPFTPHI
jgi:hypothetical protein